MNLSRMEETIVISSFYHFIYKSFIYLVIHLFIYFAGGGALHQTSLHLQIVY